MEKYFVTYNQALALKELGFDEPCLAYYEGINLTHGVLNDTGKRRYLQTPLKSQLFEWFRDKYKIEAVVACYYSKILGISYEERQYHCHIVRDGVTTKGPEFKTYEEAESACIDNLIEIAKSKKQ